MSFGFDLILKFCQIYFTFLNQNQKVPIQNTQLKI